MEEDKTDTGIAAKSAIEEENEAKRRRKQQVCFYLLLCALFFLSSSLCAIIIYVSLGLVFGSICENNTIYYCSVCESGMISPPPSP